ncbi:hypothetical protein Dda_4153 [Drechslerella dactyloides]|uniref:Uncharacterized protein n=1 Tax=Drechslerella dactyloides TaxID=74499 RepID=A0AAD6IZ84_DREDA|nr:hypothetical protein Dda_4153 [Drechslerella dactyloides]
MHFTALLLAATVPLLTAAQSLPWTGAVGPVPRFECICQCVDDPATAKTITPELCTKERTVGRMKDLKVLEDGTCALWGLEVQLFPDEVGNGWNSAICGEYEGCKAVGVCNYVTCSGLTKTEWKAPAIPHNGNEEN